MTVAHRMTAALLVTLTAGLASAPASAKSSIPWPSKACTADESWLGETAMSEYVQERVFAPGKDTDASTQTLKDAARAMVSISRNPKAAKSKPFVEYLIARSLFSLGLVHPAYQRFSAILVSPDTPAGIGVKFAALACLNQIQRQYPTIGPLAPTTMAGIYKLAASRRMPREVRAEMLDAAQRRVGQLVAADAPEADMQTELAALKGSGGPEATARVTLASRVSQETAIVPYAKLIPDKSSLRLAMGRAFYGVGRFEQAIDQLKMVKTPSPELQDAITAIAWAYLSQDKYADAMSNATNLMMGGLSHGFTPEAFSITAIALNELCNYPEALNVLKKFQRTYGTSWLWLNAWRQKRAGYNLYATLSSHLKTGKGVPERIAAEWARSPKFLANQQEINLLLDERVAVKAAIRALGKDRSGIAQWLAQGMAALQGRDAVLVNEVSTDLANRSESMFEVLNEVADTLKFVEAEAYDTLGDSILVHQAVEPQDREPAEGGGAAPTGKEAPKRRREESSWDWGRFSIEESGQTEVWEDELGALKSHTKSRCR